MWNDDDIPEDNLELNIPPIGPLVKKVLKYLIIIIFVASVILPGVGAWYTVAPEEQAVVKQFGKYVRFEGPGAHGKIPWGIENVMKVNIKEVKRSEIGFKTTGKDASGKFLYENLIEEKKRMLTGGIEFIVPDAVVQWRVYDPVKYLFHAEDPEAILIYSGQAILRAKVATMPTDDVLTTGREEINNFVKEELQSRLDDVHDIGIDIVNVNLLSVEPPEKVKDSYSDVNRAREEFEQSKNLGETYRNEIVPKAIGEAGKMILDAEGYNATIMGNAMGDAQRLERLLKTYEDTKDVTLMRLYLETMEEILPSAQKYVIRNETGNLINWLPLD